MRHARRFGSQARTLALALTLAVAGCTTAPYVLPPADAPGPPPPAGTVLLPNRSDSLKFAVLGDFGTGSTRQYQMASTMKRVHDRFRYDLVVLVGDNLYGGETPQDFGRKFEIPYKPLLDAGVKFYASLGNHDLRDQRRYPLFNMGDRLYYSLEAPRQDVRFFFFESTYMTPEQLAWIESELKGAGEDWKVVIFHHPLYSSGKHGSNLALRASLEPLLLAHNVSVVFTGHEHFYQRIKTQKGIEHFVVGGGGQLRRGDIDPRTGLTAKGFDADQSFLVGEIAGDELFFNAISRLDQVVDSGVIRRRMPAR